MNEKKYESYWIGISQAKWTHDRQTQHSKQTLKYLMKVIELNNEWKIVENERRESSASWANGMFLRLAFQFDGDAFVMCMQNDLPKKQK